MNKINDTFLKLQCKKIKKDNWSQPFDSMTKKIKMKTCCVEIFLNIIIAEAYVTIDEEFISLRRMHPFR